VASGPRVEAAAGETGAGFAGGRGGLGGGAETSLAGRLLTSPDLLGLCPSGPERAAAGGAAPSPRSLRLLGPRRSSLVAGDGRLAAAAFGRSSAGGSSTATSRRRPSRSAFLRTRSACASSMDEEWLFTPMPSDKARSSASLLVSPSSLASS